MTSMTQHMEVYKVAGMVADKKLADIELDIVADMEVEKVADMEEDKVADMVANPPKKSTLTSKLTWKSNLVRELVTGIG